MKKAGIYIRVSTQEQAQEGYSIAAQKERLISYCKAKDWLISEIYIDGGFSGSNLDRPGITKLISDISKLNVVLVYKLDRLSRSQKDTLHLIEEVFLPAGVDFVSMNESFDTGTPFGRAMIGILSVFAQLERETIKERSLMGRVERAKEGLFHGGPYYPIGYDYVDGKLIPNEYEAMQVKEIYRMYLEGAGTDKITRTLRKKGYTNRYGSWKFPSAVLNVLSSDVYTGIIRFKDVVVEDAHEPIITRETFEKAQQIQQRKRRTHKRVFESNSFLQGFVYCGICGARYYVKHNTGSYKYYTCYSRGKTAPHMVKDPNCKNKSWKLPDLDAIVNNKIRQVALDKKFFSQLVNKKRAAHEEQPKDEQSIIQKKIADINKQIGKLMDLYQLDSIPVETVSERIEALHKEKTSLRDHLSEIPGTAASDFDLEGVKVILHDISLVWDNADIDQKRLLMRPLINRVILIEEDVDVEWSFLPRLIPSS
jgi:site-specific DNA recombinase